MYKLSAFGQTFSFTRTIRCLLRRSISVSLHEVDHEGIRISWDDKQHYYHGVWLRHNCRCSLCIADHSDQKTMELIELVNSRVTKAVIQGM